MKFTLVTMMLWSCMFLLPSHPGNTVENSGSAPAPATPPEPCKGSTNAVCPPGFDSNGVCLYELDKHESRDVIIDTTSKTGQSIHFHRTKNKFNPMIAPDTSCSQDESCTGANKHPFSVDYNGKKFYGPDLQTGKVVHHKAGVSCQYTLTIDSKSADPIIIVR